VNLARGIPEPSLQELDIKVSHDRELRVKQVDLMGRLSNPGKDFVQVSDKGVRDREGRRDVDAEAAKWRASCDRRTQIRLGPADIERLIAAYAEGNTVLQLAARFKIHRTTVLTHLERNGVPRRRSGPKLSDEDVRQATVLYRDGLSLKAIGIRFLVAPDTVGKALRRVGVKIRPRRGWTST
jgi:DNA-binding CsgD family transcriptional regulator